MPPSFGGRAGMHPPRIVCDRRPYRASAIDDQDQWRRTEPIFSVERTGRHAADATKTELRRFHAHTVGHDHSRTGAFPSSDIAIGTLAARAKLRVLREPQGPAGPEGRRGVFGIWRS